MGFSKDDFKISIAEVTRYTDKSNNITSFQAYEKSEFISQIYQESKNTESYS
jgi:hypothetical protein